MVRLLAGKAEFSARCGQYPAAQEMRAPGVSGPSRRNRDARL